MVKISAIFFLALANALLVKAKSDEEAMCSDFLPGKHSDPLLHYHCVDQQRCPDGRAWGFTMYPDGTSQAMKDLIKKAQNAKCSDDDDVCCATKYIISEHPSVHNMNEISDKLFKIQPTDFENFNSSVICNLSSLAMYLSMFLSLHLLIN